MSLRIPAVPWSLGLAVAVCMGAAALATTTRERERLERLNVEETTLQAEQGRNLNQLAKLLSVLERLKRDPPPALLVSPRDAKDAVRAAILVKAMTPELQRRAQAYAVEAAEIARQRRLAAIQSEALFTDDSEQAEHAAGLRGSVAPGADAARRAAQEGPVTPPQALLAPASGPVAHRFGAPLAGGGRANGLTILTDRSAQVRSPDAARVQYVGPIKGWGVILILRLAGGYHLVLAGLDRTSVEVGQSVAAGAPVGWMPDSRQSYAELYLEVREHGVPVDPARWMKTKAG
jgi:septal ring factor EnvC (AmiA/AmiB activator)